MGRKPSGQAPLQLEEGELHLGGGSVVAPSININNNT